MAPDTADVAYAHARMEGVCTQVERVLIGKPDVVRLALVAMIAGGHVLIEDVPGVGKTLLAKTLARSVGCTWRRIQFTPDLLPSDVLGVSVFDRNTSEFVFRPGPVFANILLSDEVNRASPRTQSALLECMEERQVTVDGRTYPLPPPFCVLATQNPLEHEGTHPLPESQLDRFLLRLEVGYPSRNATLAMLEVHGNGATPEDVPAVGTPRDVLTLAAAADACYVAPQIREYVVDLAELTRATPDLSLGVSPRACLHLLRASRASAVLAARDYVLPDDVKAIAHPVLEHRLVLSAAAALAGVTVRDVLSAVLNALPVPGAR